VAHVVSQGEQQDGLMKRRTNPFCAYRPAAVPRDPTTFQDFRNRQAAHLSHIDALTVWNGALNTALRQIGAEPELTRERTIEILLKTMGDVF
jgi:hypothetical protein